MLGATDKEGPGPSTWTRKVGKTMARNSLSSPKCHHVTSFSGPSPYLEPPSQVPLDASTRPIHSIFRPQARATLTGHPTLRAGGGLKDGATPTRICLCILYIYTYVYVYAWAYTGIYYTYIYIYTHTVHTYVYMYYMYI